MTTGGCCCSFSRRVAETFSRTSSWNEGQVHVPATKGVQELLAICEDYETPGSSSAGDEAGEEEKEARSMWSSGSKSRRAALHCVLSMLEEQDSAHKKGKSVDIDDLALELVPLPS